MVLARSSIPNGYARRHGCTARDVDPTQLKIGTRVEMEHTSDRGIARQIALDHLCESPHYYVPGDVREEHLVLKRREYEKYKRGLGSGLGASCSTTPRLARGGLGFLLGGVLGAMIGGGAAVALAGTPTDAATATPTTSTLKKVGLLTAAVAVLGAAGGLAVGAWKPEC